MINEICADPVTDWSTNGWDGTDGGGSITGTDEYVELYNYSDQSVDLAGWMIVCEDSRRDTHIIDTALIRNEGAAGTVILPGGYCILGNIRGDMNNSVMVSLYDDAGGMADRVTLGTYDDGKTGDNGPDGNSPSDSDLVVGRNVYGRDTDTDSADLYVMPPSPGSGNVIAVTALISPDRTRYSGYGDSICLILTDPGLDSTPAADTITVAVVGGVGGTVFRQLGETGGGTGIFTAFYTFVPADTADGPSVIRVTEAGSLAVYFVDNVPAGTVYTGFTWRPLTAPPRIIINEVLANPSQSESDGEWVELFNADTVTADLGGWLLISDDDTTVIPSGVTLEAGGYCVAARELIDGSDADTGSFEVFWGNGSGIWGDAAAEQYAAFGVSLGLTNGIDSVAVSDGLNYTDRFVWRSDAGNGSSWERVLAGDTLWQAADIPTPGRKNSVTPAENDFGLAAGSAVAAADGDRIRLSCRVVNRGVVGGSVTAVCTVDDTLAAGTAVSPSLASGDTGTISLLLPVLTDGYHFAEYRLPDDDDSLNNVIRCRFVSGPLPVGLVVNEIMFNPDPDLEPEWIELYNAGDEAASASGLRVVDPVGSITVPDGTGAVAAGGFLLLTADSSLFRSLYGDPGCPVLQPGAWTALNNTGDDLAFYDSLGMEIERIPYDDDWMGTAKGERGVSLERIDPAGNAGASGNWWGCLDTAGATPGKVNSIAESQGVSGQIRIWSATDPFWPEGDGSTDIAFTGPPRSTATARLYDMGGRLRYEFAKELPTMGSGTVSWNGRDLDGKKLPVGIYILHIRMTGSTGTVRSAKNTVVIARPLN